MSNMADSTVSHPQRMQQSEASWAIFGTLRLTIRISFNHRLLNKKMSLAWQKPENGVIPKPN